MCAKTKRTMVVIGIWLFMVVCVTMGIWYLWCHRDGRCVCSIPGQFYAAKVYPRYGDGCLAGTTMLYSVGYVGVYDRSGDMCICWHDVTETEYEGQLLGKGD